VLLVRALGGGWQHSDLQTDETRRVSSTSR
jgi:hypothetical protein